MNIDSTKLQILSQSILKFNFIQHSMGSSFTFFFLQKKQLFIHSLETTARINNIFAALKKHYEFY